MQSLGIISVNFWQILISLANLTLIFLIVKKFLFKPVKKMIADRQSAVDAQYAAADQDRADAAKDKAAWEEKLAEADTAAADIIGKATAAADKRGDAIVAAAKDKADALLRQAESEIELERKKAESEMREEIVTISTALAEKMLEREVRADDHKQLISAFMQEIGENHDGNS